MSDVSSETSPFTMTRAELDAFLAEPRFAAVTTLRRDGSPVQTVLGFEWDGEAMNLSLRSTRLMVKRLARDPRISIAVFNNEYPPKWVVIQGTAQLVPDPGYEATRRKMMRYMAPDSPTMTLDGLDLDEFWKGYTEVGRVFYRVRPDSILSEDGVKWGDHERVAGAGVSDALARQRGELGADRGR
jgi:PPOX class probable F420-dependent enzyme